MPNNESRKKPNIVEWHDLLEQLGHPADRAAARSVFIGAIIDAVPATAFREAIAEVKKQLRL